MNNRGHAISWGRLAGGQSQFVAGLHLLSVAGVIGKGGTAKLRDAIAR